MGIGSFIIKVKEYLPFNGDWLYVTLKTLPSNDEGSEDLTQLFLELPDVRKKLDTEEDIEILKLIYERAKVYESTISTSADHVRDKAKTLLSTATFVSAIIFGVAALYVNSVIKSSLGIIIVESILFFLLISQMLRGLSLAVNVMTREGYVKQSSLELLTSSGKIKEYYKNNISQIVAYANKTHMILNIRVNDLIVAQNAYRYGLKFFVLIIYFHLMSTFLIIPDTEYHRTEKLVHLSLDKLQSSLERINSEIKNLNSNISSLPQRLNKIETPKR